MRTSISTSDSDVSPHSSTVVENGILHNGYVNLKIPPPVNKRGSSGSYIYTEHGYYSLVPDDKPNAPKTTTVCVSHALIHALMRGSSGIFIQSMAIMYPGAPDVSFYTSQMHPKPPQCVYLMH